MDVAELNRAHARDGIAFEVSPLGGPVARLAIGGSEAIVALQGAQVLGWRHEGGELLWLSPLARLGTGKAVRGGIPVCWPWFGPHPDDAAKPAHGLVRTRDWAVTTTSAGGDAISITLATATRAEDQAHFPHSAEVSLTVTLGATLGLALATRNTGARPVPLTQALHTYFRVSDIANVRVEGLAGRTYVDKLDGEARKADPGAMTFAREVDRIYLGDTSAIGLAGCGANGRRISIRSEGSASAVVWNPWTAKTIRLGDMGGPNAYRHMVCIETTNAGDDIRTLAPGECHVLSAKYQVL